MGRFIASGSCFRAVSRFSGISISRNAAAAVCRGSSVCTSPLVGRRDPLGVGLRPVRSTVASRSRAFTWQTYGVPGLLPGGMERFNWYRAAHITCVLAPRQARPARIYGPSAVAGCSMWPLSRGCPRTGSLERIPVGDATALGTFRTRLETRTKESNMCASHWDFFERNLKAQ